MARALIVWAKSKTDKGVSCAVLVRLRANGFYSVYFLADARQRLYGQGPIARFLRIEYVKSLLRPQKIGS